MSNHYSVTICDYRSVQSRAGKQFSMPPRSAWALLRGPWQTWHFESLNHLTGIQTSQTLCLKDLAPKFKKTNVSNFAPLSQLNYQFWREIWLNCGEEDQFQPLQLKPMFAQASQPKCLLAPGWLDRSARRKLSMTSLGKNGWSQRYKFTIPNMQIIYDHLWSSDRKSVV